MEIELRSGLAPTLVVVAVVEGILPPQRRVDQQEPARFALGVVSADDADKHRRMVRDGPGPDVRGGKIRPAAPQFHLPGTVGVHVEHVSRVVVRNVGVFPAEVDHSPIVVDARVPVAVLLESKLADLFGLRVDLVEVHHRLSAVLAGQTLHTGG